MLEPKYVDGSQDIGNNTGDTYIKVEMPFNSLMTEIFDVLNVVILKSWYNVCLRMSGNK